MAVVEVTGRDNKKLLAELLQTYTLAQNRWQKYYQQIEKNYTMVRGGEAMWDKALREQLTSEGRPLISINIELPLVQQLVGQFIRNPRSWNVVPVDDQADIRTAGVLRKVMLWIADNNNLDEIEHQVVEDAVIAGYGGFYVMMDYDEDPTGLIRIYPVSPIDVAVDYNARDRNQRDWRWVFYSKWFTWEDLKSNPEWEDKLPDRKRSWDEINRIVDQLPSPLREQSLGHIADEHAGLYRVIEYWRRKWKPVYFMYHAALGAAMAQSPEEAAAYESQGFQNYGERRQAYMEVVVALPALSVILDRKIYPTWYYPFAMFYPLKLGSLPLIESFSYTYNLHSLQEEKMRNRSAMSDYLQKMASGTVILPPGEEELAQELQLYGSRPNQYFVRRTMVGNIEKLHRDMPRDFIEVDRMNNDDLRMVSGQPLASGGYSENAGEPGVLFELKIRQGEITMSSILSHFSDVRKLLGKIVLSMISTQWTMRKIIRITGRGSQDETVILNDREVVDGTTRIFNNPGLGTYDVQIEETAGAEHSRDLEMKYLSQMMLSPGMPPEFVPHVFLEVLKGMRRFADKEGLITKLEQMINNRPGTIPDSRPITPVGGIENES